MQQYKKTVYVCVWWITVSFAMRCQWMVKEVRFRQRERKRERRGRERKRGRKG